MVVHQEGNMCVEFTYKGTLVVVVLNEVVALIVSPDLRQGQIYLKNGRDVLIDFDDIADFKKYMLWLHQTVTYNFSVGPRSA